MPTLHVLQGPDKGRTYQTPNEPAVIGRSSDHVQLTDNSISRFHAELRPDNGSWLLVDLNSSNGTFLNGRRIVLQAALKYGDQIRVGGTLLVFNGEAHVQSFTGTPAIRDLVDLDLDRSGVASSIISSVDALEESVILQPPETADAVAAWNVVYKIAELIGTGGSLGLFLARVADTIFEYLIVDRLILLIADAETGELKPEVVRYRNQPPGKRPKITTSRTITDHVLKTKVGVLCANAMNDDRFGSENLQDSIHRLGLTSIICVPILVRDQVYGVIHMDCFMSHHTYTHEQLRLAIAISRLTGMAIENAQLLEHRVRNERLAATGEAVAYLSHHIRNMLQGIQGGADVVELGLRKGSFDTIKSGWALVRRNLDRTYHLALNMLTFGKDRKPRFEDTQLNDVVEDVISLTQSRADEKGVMILPELAEIPSAQLDDEGVHQVVHNILLNAIQAVPAQSGRINIRTSLDKDRACVVLSIVDNGPGIPPEDVERIFDFFHSSKGQGGTGLGLAAARKTVTELGGEIDFDSTVGEGTTFYVRLPLSRREGGAATNPALPETRVQR